MLHSRHFECTVERGVYWAGCLRIEIQLYTMFIQLGIYLMTVFGEHETSIFTRVFRLKPSSPQGFIHSSKRHKKSELTWQVVFLHEERTRIDTYNSCGGLLITGNSKKSYIHMKSLAYEHFDSGLQKPQAQIVTQLQVCVAESKGSTLKQTSLTGWGSVIYKNSMHGSLQSDSFF